MLSSTVSNDCNSPQSRVDVISTYPSCGLASVNDLPTMIDPRRVPLQQRNVYISGLPPHLSSGDFRALCQRFGRVEASKLCGSGRKKSRQGYGFALFYTDESAAACIQGLNNALLCGRRLQARYADPGATPREAASCQDWATPSVDGLPPNPLYYVVLPLCNAGLLGPGASLDCSPVPGGVVTGWDCGGLRGQDLVLS